MTPRAKAPAETIGRGPWDYEALALGKCIANSSHVEYLLERLTPGNFEKPGHRAIFEAIRALYDRAEPVSFDTVLMVLEQAKNFEATVALSRITVQVKHTSDAPLIIRKVAEDAEKAALRSTLSDIYSATSNGLSLDDLRARMAYATDSIKVESKERKPVDVGQWAENEAPPRDWIVNGAIPSDVLCGLDAKGGRGKSQFLMQLCLSIASGQTLFSSLVPARPAKVLYIESEDAPDELHRRFRRVINFYKFDDGVIGRLRENLLIYPGEGFPLVSSKDGNTAPTEHYEWLKRIIRRHQPRFIALDPRAHFFGGDENSNSEIGRFMRLLSDLCREVEGGASIWLNHHVAKARESDVDSAVGRGASAARDAQRVLWTLSDLTKEEIKDAGIALPHLYIKLEQTKANYSEMAGGPIYLKRETGDFGGVLREVDLTKQKEDIAKAALDNLAKFIAKEIGDNEDELTVREFLKRPKGLDFRDSVKAKFGKSCTATRIEYAIEYAGRCGFLTIENTVKRGHTARIPKCGEVRKIGGLRSD